jgi:hypothetical protein
MLEISKAKGKAKCRICKKLIKKDTLELVEWRGNSYMATHYCFNCLVEELRKHGFKVEQED